MDYFKYNVKKIDLMKFIKANFNDYTLVEKESEYKEIYKSFTANCFVLKPNKFKKTNQLASMYINKDNAAITISHLKDRDSFELLNKFNRLPIDKQLVVDVFNEVYQCGIDFQFFVQEENVENKLSEWLDNEKTLRGNTEISLKYGIVGKTTTGRSQSASGKLNLNEHYYMMQDLSIVTCNTLEFPLKSFFKMTVSILHKEKETAIYLKMTQSGLNLEVTDKKIRQEKIKNRFIERYQSAIKKSLNIEKAEYNEEFLLLLAMSTI